MNIQFQVDFRTAERGLPFECVALGCKMMGRIIFRDELYMGACRSPNARMNPAGAVSSVENFDTDGVSTLGR